MRGRPKIKDKQDEEQIPPGTPTKECPKCKKVLEASKFFSHLFQHRMFLCPFCFEVFRRKEIQMHIAGFHQKEIHFPCIQCTLKFDSFNKLRKHCLLEHLGVKLERVECKICNKTFSNISGLKVHVSNMHTKGQLFECPICKETFNQKGNMKNHVKRLHQGEEAKTISCDVCKKTFILPSDLRKHAERAHLKLNRTKVTCEICLKKFYDSRALKVHVNAVHTKEIQYPCPDCNIIFHSSTNMHTHRRRMHRIDSRKHVCDRCNKAFCSPSDLKVHVEVVHENLRKYACDICKQTFKVSSHLKYHMRKHTGEMPFECPHCGKTYHSPSHISDHVKKVHRTVYLGVHYRRRLNIPEDAPPPPPGILPSRDQKVKNILQPLPPVPSNNTSNMPVMPQAMPVHGDTSSSIPLHPLFVFNCQSQMIPVHTLGDQTTNYVNLPYDQTNN